MSELVENFEATVLDQRLKVFVWMAALFVASLIIANLTGGMLFSFQAPWGGPVILSAGIIPFPITFILTDLLNEFYGKQGARFVTLVGFAMCLLIYIVLTIGQNLPVAPISNITLEQFRHFSQQYTGVQIFEGIFIASLTAYLVGQFLDIQIFHIFKGITQNKHIWLRATGSTVISQLFDSFIVIFIAFWGDYSIDTLFNIATSNYLWKFIIAVGITPILYLGHFVIRGFLRAPGQSRTI